MTMTEENNFRQQEIALLMSYIKMLRDLLNNGFKCEKELNEALKKLHSLMFNKTDEVALPINVLILEKDFDGICKSHEVFTKILGSKSSAKRINDDFDIVNGNKNIRILKITHQNDSRLAGLRPDYIINNTDIPDDFLPIRTK